MSGLVGLFSSQTEVTQQQKASCKYFGSAQGCRYGKRCHYSHKNPESVPLCRHASSPSGCRFGHRCRFRHNEYQRITSSNTSNTFCGSPTYKMAAKLIMPTMNSPNADGSDREIIYLTDGLKRSRWTNRTKLSCKSFECHMFKQSIKVPCMCLYASCLINARALILVLFIA